MLEGEDLLFVPDLHWMYVIKPAVLFLLLISVLLIVWWVVTPSYAFNANTPFIGSYVGIFSGYMFWIIAVITAIILVCRILLYIGIEYGITNKRLLMKRGSIRIRTAEIPMDKIKSVYCQQGLLGRIFNYGTICIAGTGDKMLVLFMICKPYAIRRKIVSIIEKNKAITVVHGELPKPVVIPEPVVEEEPPYRYGTFVRIVE